MSRKRKKSKESPVNSKKVNKSRKTMEKNGGKKTDNRKSKPAEQSTKNLQSEQSEQMSKNHKTSNTTENGSSPATPQMQASQSSINGHYTPLPMNFNYLPRTFPYNINSQLASMNTASPFLQGNTPTSSTSSPQSDPITIIIQRLESLDTKLTSLEKMQSTINSLQNTIGILAGKIESMEKRVQELESNSSEEKAFRELNSAAIEIINQKQCDREKELQRVKNFEKCEDPDATTGQSSVQEEILDLKCRSMRDNLMFYKIPEENSENCEEKVLKFIENEMKVENAQSEIKLHRAHRVGKYSSTKTRPIVAKFVYYPDRERVRKSTHNLKGTEYGVSEQFPREIVERRKKLIPIMRQARSEGKKTQLKVDKLYIDNKLYRSYDKSQ